jgi:hypothetical protein
MELRWGDPEAPWWVKLRRAKSHVSEVRQRVDVLQVAEPWSIQREPAGPDGWAYRFRVHKPAPGRSRSSLRGCGGQYARRAGHHRLPAGSLTRGNDE